MVVASQVPALQNTWPVGMAVSVQRESVHVGESAEHVTAQIAPS